MIEFNDLSHWNTSEQFVNAINSEPRVVALKATEGETYTDPTFKKRVAMCGAGTCIIAYHFLRRKDVEKEMRHYMATLAAMERPFVMALDYESPYCSNHYDDFCYLTECVSYLLTKTGKEPYVYINDSQLKACEKYGFRLSWLWVAKWSKTPPERAWGIWQHTNRPIDKNFFASDDISLLKRHEVTVKI